MSNSQNESFKNFLRSFKEGEYNNHKFYDSITEISRKESGDRTPLITNQKEMYSLDDIANHGSVRYQVKMYIRNKKEIKK